MTTGTTKRIEPASLGEAAASLSSASSASASASASAAPLAGLSPSASARPILTSVPAWPMPPLVQATIGVHLAVAGVALMPGGLAWAAAVLVANHALLTAQGLWPRSSGLGPNVRRLPDTPVARDAVALTIDDGPDPAVTPAVLDLLDRHSARATFFCIAERAAAQPRLTREIVERGHSVQNHSMVHRHHFSVLGPSGLTRELSGAQQVLTDLTGVVPTCFRAPAGLRNPFLDPVLHRLNLHLVSWTRRGFDTRERRPQRVLDRLQRGLSGRDIVLLHDGHAARQASGQPVLLDVLPRLLDRCGQLGLRTVCLPEVLPPRHARGA